jgi:Nif-specific regulatory protein
VDFPFRRQRDYDHHVRSLRLVAAMIALAVRVERLVDTERQRLLDENTHLREELKERYDFSRIVGTSGPMRQVYEQIARVARANTTVLIRGESGTGKELIAHAIHYSSPRASKPFVKVSCAALPDSLIESELFGYEKGAFTGAGQRKLGRFELAHRGTLFLDEVGDIPPDVQPKLLRTLQEREFERLGSTRTHRVDVRLIAATNRDLEQMIKDGKFRQDLYYRLSVFPIQIPPLRRRREDIPALVWHLLQDQCTRMGKDVKSIHHDTLKAFQQYSWPGNVRELRNLIERYLILNPGPVFRAEVPELAETRAPAGQQLDEVERLHILQVLQSTRFRIRGNGGAAEHLGLKPTTLEARMKKLGIVRPQWSVPGSIPMTDHTSGIRSN